MINDGKIESKLSKSEKLEESSEKRSVVKKLSKLKVDNILGKIK